MRWRSGGELPRSAGNLSPSFYEPFYVLAGCHALLGGVAGAAGSGVTDAEGRAELDRAVNALTPGHCDRVSLRRLDACATRISIRCASGADFKLLIMDLAFPVEPFAIAEPS